MIHRYSLSELQGSFLALSWMERMCVMLCVLSCSGSLLSRKLPTYSPGSTLFIPLPMAEGLA